MPEIHGHSYRMSGEAAASRRERHVLDYLVLKESCSRLLNEIDHSFLCDEADEVVAKFLQQIR